VTRAGFRNAWRTRLLPCLSLALVVVGVASCGSSNSSSSGSGSSSSGSGGTKTIKVGIVVIGPVNDHAYSQQNYDGILKAIKDTANGPVRIVKGGVIQNADTPQKQVDAFKTLAQSGNNVVILGSAQFAPVADQLADRYPNVYFIESAGLTAHFHKNVTSVEHDQGPAGFVAGVVQGKLTKSNVIGYVGSLQIPVDVVAQAGWTAGAKMVDPKVKVLAARTGDFNDIGKANDLATSELQQGADQIYGFVDSGIVGVYKAGSASGKNPGVVNISGIGNTNGCQGQSYSNVVGNTLSNYTNIMHDALIKYAAGQLKPGAALLGLHTPQYMTFIPCNVSNSIKATVKSTIAGIVSGKISVPSSAQLPKVSYPERNDL